jgi:hypothetical protein
MDPLLERLSTSIPPYFENWCLPAVRTEDLFINNGSNGKTIEAVSKSLPYLDVISSFTYYTINTKL